MFSLSSYKLKATRVILGEEMNSGVKTSLCLMLVEFEGK